MKSSIGTSEISAGISLFDPCRINGLTTPLWIFDIDHSRVVWANEAAVNLWHSDSAEELYARDMGADMSASIEERLKQYQIDFMAGEKRFSEIWTLYPNGTPHTYRLIFSGHLLPGGRMGMLCEALAEENETPERLRSAEALNSIPVSISLFDKNGVSLYCNASARSIYGSPKLSLESRFFNVADHDRLLAELEVAKEANQICQVWTENGLRWHELSAQICVDAVNGSPAIVLSEFDVTELKEQESKVRYLAHRDTLTGLFNRNYVQLAFSERLRKAEKTGQKLAMILLDLDKFKAINDTLGHPSGDRLLVHVARALESLIGRNGQIARLGGDEFIILQSFSSSDELDELCRTILKHISSDCVIGEHRLNSHASIGISLFPSHGTDLSTLMKHADLALYDSKDAGRNTFSYFRPALQRAMVQQRVLERDLTQAIAREEFTVFYQPRVNCKNQKVKAVEALLRWRHPERGLLGPGLFIETLEETGLIHQVGNWLTRQIGKDQRRMTAEGFDIPIAINVSPKQFELPDFCNTMVDNLARTGCRPERVELEITETMLMGNGFDSRQLLQDLRDQGFSIAIDDFGTGYSNLAYIQDYPISCLKVDKSFVQSIGSQGPVVNLILSLCRLMGIESVAEGVETEDQLTWLQMNHCNQFQGYLYSRPKPLTELLELFNKPPAIKSLLEEDAHDLVIVEAKRA